MIDSREYAKITEHLNEFCIPKQLLGFDFLVTGISILQNNPDVKITLLYDEIAKMHNTKASNVERSIRHAIKCAYDNCMDCKFDTFKRICFTNKKPSNSEFLKSVTIELILKEAY